MIPSNISSEDATQTQAKSEVLKRHDTPQTQLNLPAETAQVAVSKSPVDTNSQTLSKTYTNSIGMEFVLIPAGSFMMGCDPNVEKECDRHSETPQHMVTISQPFYLGKYPVTQKQWEAIMESNPSKFKSQDNPVEQVSWDYIQTFIKWLKEKESVAGYRLPTEAEWEYAARAGTTSTYFWGTDQRDMSRYAWYTDNYEQMTHPVGQKHPNPWGLYDIYGNVREWVQDLYSDEYYGNTPTNDPQGPSFGLIAGRSSDSRVARGGGGDERSAARSAINPSAKDAFIGFRRAFSPGQ